MNDDAPTILYKYRAPDIGRLVDILLGNALWAPRPTELNDPFDCYPHINLTGTYEEAISWMRLRMTRGGPVVSEEQLHALATKIAAEGLGAILDDQNPMDVWRDSVSQFGIISFSAENSNILMWSHYAQNHTGVCLAFSGEMDPFRVVADVQYKKERPEFRPLHPDRQKLMQRILLRKSKIWEYEEEWRYFQIKETPGLVRFEPACLKAIILGAAVQPRFVKQLQLVLDARPDPVVIKRATLDLQTYSLQID